MIILDFDGVLFNDERFKRDLWRLFGNFCIPHHIHQAAYREARMMYDAYRHDTHLSLMRREMPSLDTSKLNHEITLLLSRSRRYLYRDALPFVAYAKKRGERLSLASNGYEFQKKKVAGSGIAPLLDAVVVASGPKSAMIRRLVRRFRPRRIFFLDDKKSVADEVKQKMPDIAVLQILRRKGTERSSRADAVLPNLSAARRFIERCEQ